MNKTAFRIEEIAKAGPFSRSFIFKQIRLGHLTARKAGRSTVILFEDWQNFLANLPPVNHRRAA